uniref:Collagen n=1 Tax=Globodera rostochiensis TaxID=31243 RepID=A0A914I1V1_GLORO
MSRRLSALLQPAELIAQVGIGASCLALCALLWSTHSILCEIELIQSETEHNAAAYRANSERIWSKIRVLADAKVSKAGGLSSSLLHPLVRRDTKAKKAIREAGKGAEFQALKGCQKCTRMNCPVGPTGLPGQPGEDSTPGAVGKLGVPGMDGTDIEENPLPDMPCIVCSAGYPGPRGTQGERGLLGPSGLRGKYGPPGQFGQNGSCGKAGPAGRRGRVGMPGKAGSVGQNVVGGVGVKGPLGLPGPEGPTGFPGLAGRLSKIVGQPGRQGPRGLLGVPGECGGPGAPGPQALAGAIGRTPNFCPMHCPATARGQPLFVPMPSNNDDFVFPPTLMMSHDEAIAEESAAAPAESDSKA